MGNKKLKLGFEPNSIVKAIGPTGDEVWGVVHERSGKMLRLRALNKQAMVHAVSIPLETYRVDAIPDRTGLGGLVEALYDEREVHGRDLRPFIPLLPKRGAVIDKLLEDLREDEVIIALISHQGQSEVERFAANKGHKHRFRALTILDDQEKYLTIAKDKDGESPVDRKRAVRQLKSQELLLEIALSADQPIANEAALHVHNSELRLRLYLESDHKILNEADCPIVQVYADSAESAQQYEQIVLHAKCYGIRRQALDALRGDEAKKQCLNKLMDQIAIWDTTEPETHDVAWLVRHLFRMVSGYDHDLAKKFLRIPGVEFTKDGTPAAITLSVLMPHASPDESIELIEILRETQPHKYGIPPRAKITTQMVHKICKTNGWCLN